MIINDRIDADEKIAELFNLPDTDDGDTCFPITSTQLRELWDFAFRYGQERGKLSSSILMKIKEEK